MNKLSSAGAERKDRFAEAREAEHAIFKELYKSSMKKALPELDRFFVDVGSLFSKEVDSHQVFDMQKRQILSLENLNKDIEPLGVLALAERSQLEKMTYTVSSSILKTPESKGIVEDGKGFEDTCKKVLDGHFFSVGTDKKEYHKKVLQQAQLKASQELLNEKVTGMVVATVVSCSVLGCIHTANKVCGVLK